MALRKLYIVIDCTDDAQKERVQHVLDEISNMRAFDGNDVIKMKPMFDKNKTVFTKIFRAISQGGTAGIMKCLPLLAQLKR